MSGDGRIKRSRFQWPVIQAMMLSLAMIGAMPGLGHAAAMKSAPSDTLASAPSVMVHRFIYDGNTVFSDDALNRVVNQYIGHRISAEQLQQAKKLLTTWYVQHGYINSGVVIPDQEIGNDGTIRLHIIEGRLTRVQLHGNHHLRDGYILDRLASVTDPKQPLNLKQLQRRLLLMRQNPRIKKINAEVTHGLHPGEATMVLQVEERKPWFLTLKASNQSPPAVGSYRGDIALGSRNLTGLGDTIRLAYGTSSGSHDYNASYALPLNRYDTTIKVQSALSKALIVTDQFKALDIRSQFRSNRIDLQQPLIHTLNREVAIGVGYEIKHNRTSLLGQPFSFSAGVVNGQSKSQLLHLYQSWTEKSAARVVAVRSTFGLGLNKDATITPDGSFLTWLGQFQWIERMSDRWGQLIVRSDLRLANDNLPSTEKFVLGGQQTVRGYRENLLTADAGVVAGIEWRLPIAKAHLPGLSKRVEDGQVTLHPFVDFGRIWNQKVAAPTTRQLASVGLGIHWQINSSWFLQLDGAKGLNKVNTPGKYFLQDNGVHFVSELAL